MKNSLKILGHTISKGFVKHTTSKSFYLGIILAVGMFSKYIFGPDNLAEQTAEFLHKSVTGREIDFSPEVEEKNKKQSFYEDLQF